VAKLIILSIIIMTFAVPIYLSGAPQPRRSLQRAQLILFLYMFVWAYLCVRWYPQLTPLQ
jgi:hypothetical protein